jgi:hypothetical protein
VYETGKETVGFEVSTVPVGFLTLITAERRK